MKTFSFDNPCCSTVPTDTEPSCGSRDHNAGINWVRKDFVDVAVDVDGGLPSHTAVRRPRDAPDVNVREEHGAVRCRGDRANPERWPNVVAVNECRARIPCISPRHGVKAAELVDLASYAHAQSACVVGPDVHVIANRDGARELKIARRDRAPLTVRRASAKRMSIDDGDGAAMPVGRKRSNRPASKLLPTALTGEGQQPIAPRGHKNSWSRQITRGL